MRPKGANKTEGSGRKKGTPNRKTQILQDICEQEGVDPFRGLLEITRSDDTNLRFQALKEVCQYLYPKRKSLEHDISDEQLLDIVNQKLKEDDAAQAESA